ncbi:MAG: hypothetical protein GX817_01055 [Elusimicrobia bacterium]|nr:hypothetical protein [Elusimicrobiota bacterium]
MTSYDRFIDLLKKDYKRLGMTIEDVADIVGLGPRQLARHIKGDTKERIMPVRTVADMSREGIISQKTVDAYWQGIRAELKLKKRKTAQAAR